MNSNEIGELTTFIIKLKNINIENKVSIVFENKDEVSPGITTAEFFLDYKNIYDKIETLIQAPSIHRYLNLNNINGRSLTNLLTSLIQNLNEIKNVIIKDNQASSIQTINNDNRNNRSKFNTAFNSFREIILTLQSIDLWYDFNTHEKIKLSTERREIAALKISYSKLKSNLEVLHAIQKEKNETIEKDYSEYLEKKGEAEKLIESLNLYRKTFEGIKLEFARIEGEISNQKNNISDSTKKIQEILESGEEATNKTQKYISDSEKLFLNIEEKISTYEKSNNKLSKLINGRETLEVLRGFDQRKKQLEKSLKFWGGLSILGLLIWSFSAFKFFPTEALLEKTKLLDVLIVLIPFSLKIIPQSVLVIFSLRQYSNERKTLEAYAFKAAQVLLLDNHADKFKENKSTKDIFLNNTLEKIHDEPFKKSSSVPEFTKKDIHKTLFRVEKIAKIFLGKKGLSLNINADKKTGE